MSKFLRKYFVSIISWIKSKLGRGKTMSTDSSHITELDVLGQEIAKAHMKIRELHVLIEQCDANFDVYTKHHEFFYSVYFAFFDELIHTISRLHDTSRGALSIVLVLEEYIKSYPHDAQFEEERTILEEIENHPTRTKIKNLRNKLGKAHLDRTIAMNPKKQIDFYGSNKTDLKSIYKYLQLLTRALELISQRFDKPTWYLPSNTLDALKIHHLFASLKAVNKLRTLCLEM